MPAKNAGHDSQTGINQRAILNPEHHTPRETAHKLARRALFGFLITFVLSRICVFLIMSDEMPNLYFFVGKTHVHHLNYGIFLLAAVCGYSVFRRPVGRPAEITALVYGLAMGLTFDEFGMWLHLGGSYWQRASIDAVIVVAALFALVAFGRTVKKFEARHFWAFIILLVLMIGFGYVLHLAGNRIGNEMGPTLERLEAASSP
ncbi:MAG TPA: hypothetical protein VMD27_13725 [Candidatus Aquilonibacter sp.]|nr:hypothetical protein [Candidatus Aquilonibacter sp.]